MIKECTICGNKYDNYDGGVNKLIPGVNARDKGEKISVIYMCPACYGYVKSTIGKVMSNVTEIKNDLFKEVNK